MQTMTVAGFKIIKNCLTRAQQELILDDLRHVVAQAPLVQHATPGGRKMSVRMSAAGRFGWVSDARGYRYQDHHPDGQSWPDIPARILDLWKLHADCIRAPECCLINYYSEKARMGMHQDIDEVDFDCPVLSISLGDPATFRMGGENRSDPTNSILLESGDVVVMAGAARKAFHGIDRIRFGRSDLLTNGGRINLTLRVVR